ncbi:hypothetical protein DFJ77DRAFT_443106 [Powellomyces hirtus]|nr:hypothetical protein DFJ77DRAFT_443106 [Powellomyces hirtus]
MPYPFKSSTSCKTLYLSFLLLLSNFAAETSDSAERREGPLSKKRAPAPKSRTNKKGQNTVSDVADAHTTPETTGSRNVQVKHTAAPVQTHKPANASRAIVETVEKLPASLPAVEDPQQSAKIPGHTDDASKPTECSNDASPMVVSQQVAGNTLSLATVQLEPLLPSMSQTDSAASSQPSSGACIIGNPLVSDVIPAVIPAAQSRSRLNLCSRSLKSEQETPAACSHSRFRSSSCASLPPRSSESPSCAEAPHYGRTEMPSSPSTSSSPSRFDSSSAPLPSSWMRQHAPLRLQESENAGVEHNNPQPCASKATSIGYVSMTPNALQALIGEAVNNAMQAGFGSSNATMQIGFKSQTAIVQAGVQSTIAAVQAGFQSNAAVMRASFGQVNDPLQQVMTELQDFHSDMSNPHPIHGLTAQTMRELIDESTTPSDTIALKAKVQASPGMAENCHQLCNSSASSIMVQMASHACSSLGEIDTQLTSKKGNHPI